jgi:hypothetical protein
MKITQKSARFCALKSRAMSLEYFTRDALCPRIPIIKLPQKCRTSLTDIFCADGKVRLLSSGATQLSL